MSASRSATRTSVEAVLSAFVPDDAFGLTWAQSWNPARFMPSAARSLVHGGWSVNVTTRRPPRGVPGLEVLTVDFEVFVTLNVAAWEGGGLPDAQVDAFVDALSAAVFALRAQTDTYVFVGDAVDTLPTDGWCLVRLTGQHTRVT